jgi:cytochrome P450
LQILSRTLPNTDNTLEQECDDIREIYRVTTDFSTATNPGHFLADVFPLLAKLPPWLQTWRTECQVCFERQRKLWLKYWRGLSAQIAAGTAPDCFVKHFQTSSMQSKAEIDELQAAFVAGTMIEAGSETTSALINLALLLLAIHPAKAQLAQDQLDRVVGPNRCPLIADQDDLPYIRAVVKEVLYCRPPPSPSPRHIARLWQTKQ